MNSKAENARKACILILTSAVNLIASSPAFADQAFIIGGGYSLLSSQGQIELNVQYARESLQDEGIDVTTFFTDGGAPGKDVFAQFFKPADNTYSPIARVFGDYLEQHREYWSSTLEDIAGSTRRDTLLPSLERLLSAAESPTWLLYNGHGSQSASTTDQVTLELWDRTQVTAAELHAIVKTSKQPLRYAFTQCYSGGFHALAYDEPHGSLTPASPQRCGFTAVSAYSLAEGCSSSINTEDYRDYTTHFFAALSGYDRNGDTVVSEPDTDGNGQVSPREAHMYTLLNANSTDISRSTSEDFLERWEPWYLKWTPDAKDLPANEYTRLFHELAGKLDISIDQHTIRTIRSRLNTLENDRLAVNAKITQTGKNVRRLQQTIAEPVITKWPALLGPYSRNFQTLADDGAMSAISESIRAHPDYQTLVDSDSLIQQLGIEKLALDRQATNLHKLLYLRRLASLKPKLYEYGSPTDIASYNSFVQCESMPINSESNTGKLAEQYIDE